MDKRKVNGYLTVEASLLMPLITILIWLIFFLGIMMYNICVLSCISYQVSLRGSLLTEYSTMEKKEIVEKEAERMMEEHLVMCAKREYKVWINKDTVNVTLRIKMDMPMQRLISDKLIESEITKSSKAWITEPENRIRSIRRGE